MIPARTLLFGCDARWHCGLASQQIQRQLADEGEILRAFTCARSIGILPHGHIQPRFKG